MGPVRNTFTLIMSNVLMLIYLGLHNIIHNHHPNIPYQKSGLDLIIYWRVLYKQVLTKFNYRFPLIFKLIEFKFEIFHQENPELIIDNGTKESRIKQILMTLNNTTWIAWPKPVIIMTMQQGGGQYPHPLPSAFIFQCHLLGWDILQNSIQVLRNQCCHES